MIDWWAVFSNAIWISGAALALAAMSYASWQASIDGQRLRQALGRPAIQAVLNIAGALFSLGLAATARGPLEIGVWLLLAGLFIYQWIRDRRATP
ncbi:MAG: hypothetical protein HY870_19290 [Chloroflexi bacterium]|nr:hypothetical protein [Chloroflexota bacterium]